jgi:hypothetical protein
MYIVSIWKKIFYCFIKQPRLSFPSRNHFQIWGEGLTTVFYGWASLNKKWKRIKTTFIFWPSAIWKSKKTRRPFSADVSRLDVRSNVRRDRISTKPTRQICFQKFYSRSCGGKLIKDELSRRKKPLVANPLRRGFDGLNVDCAHSSPGLAAFVRLHVVRMALGRTKWSKPAQPLCT